MLEPQSSLEFAESAKFTREQRHTLRSEEKTATRDQQETRRKLSEKMALDDRMRRLLPARGSATWEELRRELGRTFESSAAKALMYTEKRVRQSFYSTEVQQLAQRRRLPGESVRTYVAEMEGIAARANVSPAETRKYIIRGFTGAFEVALVLSFASTRKEFIELLERYSEQDVVTSA